MSGKETKKQTKRPHPDTASNTSQISEDDVSLLSSANLHAPLLMPKREKDYSDRPPCPIPRDPRQRATNVVESSTNEPPIIPVEIVVKQEPIDEVALQSEIEIKEERLDESETTSNWKEQWLVTHPSTNASTPEPDAVASNPSQIAVNLGPVNIKQEPQEEPEQQAMEDQCSVDSGSTIGLPSPKRMDSFSPPPSPIPSTSQELNRYSTPLDLQEEFQAVERINKQPSKSKYSAPLDLEEEERREQEEQRLAGESQSRGFSPTQDDDVNEADESVGNWSDLSGPPALLPHEMNESLEGWSDQSGPPPLIPGESESANDSNDRQGPPALPPPEEAEPPKKKSTFQVVKNPEVFKDVLPTETSSQGSSSQQINDSMEADGTPRVNKIPAKVTKQNRSSLLVEDYLKAVETPVPVKRQAVAHAQQKAAKRQKSAHESVDVHVDLNVGLEATPGTSRDPRLNKSNTTESIPPPDFTTNVKNNIIRRIVKWNGNWVEEQLNLTEEPSLLQGLKDPKLDELSVVHTLSAYSTPKAYLSVYHALLLHEIWWSIVRQYRKMYAKKKLYQWQGILQGVSDEILGKDDIKLVRFTTMINEKDDKTEELKLIREGDLITCLFAKPKSPENRKAFGYVMSSRVTYGMRNKKFDSRLSSGDKDILIEAVIGFRQGYVSSIPGGPVRITKTASLKSLMSLFDYEGALKESTMNRVILKPDENAFKLLFGGPRYTAPRLDQAQLDAVIAIAQTMMMSPPEEPKVALLEGAPGTGKTHFIVFLMENLLAYKQKRPRILFCTQTDSAVDEFTRRLLMFRENSSEQNKFKIVRLGGRHTTHPAVVNYTVGGTIHRKNLESRVKSNFSHEMERLEARLEELKRQKASIIQDIIESEKAMDERVTDDLKRKLDDIDDETRTTTTELEDVRLRDREDMEEQLSAIKMDIISSADVVCTSMDPALNPELDDYLKCVKKLKHKSDRPYLCCVIDDAAQCWEPGSLLPLCFGVNKLVLVGDADPLYNELNSPVAKKHGLGKSLFARFQEFVNRSASEDARLKIRLQVQYRMHPDICRWPAKFYYGSNMLIPESQECQTPLHPYIVLDVKDGREQGDGDYLINEAEARVIAKIVVEAFQKSRFSGELTEKSVAVLTFSEKQKELINSEISNKYKEIESAEGPLKKQQLEVALAKDLQGKEKDIVFVSCVKAAIPPKKRDKQTKLKLDFITDHWNSALTRAKETLVVVGKLRALLCDESETLWDFVADAEKRQVIREVSSRYHTTILYDTLEKPDLY